MLELTVPLFRDFRLRTFLTAINGGLPDGCSSLAYHRAPYKQVFHTRLDNAPGRQLTLVTGWLLSGLLWRALSLRESCTLTHRPLPRSPDFHLLIKLFITKSLFFKYLLGLSLAVVIFTRTTCDDTATPTLLHGF